MKSHKNIPPLGGLTSISYYGEYPSTEVDPIYASISIDQDLDGAFDYEFLTLYAPDPDPLSPTAGQVFNSGSIDLPQLDQGLLRLMMKKGAPSAPCGDLGNADVEDFYIGVEQKSNGKSGSQKLASALISSQHRRQEVEIYPNPSSGLINLRNHHSLWDFNHMGIYNSSGHLIFERKNLKEPPRQLDLSFLAEGYYIMKIRRNSSVETKKILIIKH